MSGRASEIVILCEDQLQEVVVRRFLSKGWNVPARKIRVVSYPNGKQAGEQHVRERYPNELKAYHQRKNSATTILIAVIDADKGSVMEHNTELDNAARSHGATRRASSDSVIHVIPKHHIETWLAYLDGASPISEDSDYKKDYAFKDCEAKAHPLAERLAELCKTGKPLPNAPDSLRRACQEFERIRGKLQP